MKRKIFLFMSLIIGQAQAAIVTPANVVITNSTTLQTVGLTSINAPYDQDTYFETQRIRLWVPFSVGATGGIKCMLTPIATGPKTTTFTLYNTVTGAITTKFQSAPLPSFSNAIANAGSHWLEIEFWTGGLGGEDNQTIDILFAQNSSDPNSLTILRGAHLECLKARQ
jgi:hypothetical protein